MSDAEESDALNSSWSYSDDDSEQSEEVEEGDTGHTEPVGSLDDVLRTVREEFGGRIEMATEAVMANMATLLLDEVQACAGIMVVGPSGAGKTTTLTFVEDAVYDGEELVYRSDDFTHASFVSHDTSHDEEELADNDLLPKIKHRTLVAPDMNTWYTGSEEHVRKKMTYLARVMDGEGLIRNTGAHGERGYEGDLRFAVAGATTPLAERSWNAMGTVGNRLLFHELPGEDDIENVIANVFSEKETSEKVARCQSVVSGYLQQLWSSHGGYSSVDWELTEDTDVQNAIGYLGNLVKYARAPVEEGADGKREPQREDAHRVVKALRNLARGHALLCNRDQIEMEDVEVCARVALSTMHKERRGIVRAVVDPETDNEMTTSEIMGHDATEASRKTIIDRMYLLDDLEIGAMLEGDSGRGTKRLALFDDFRWPDPLPFPRR